jgi:hypothetical protein
MAEWKEVAVAYFTGLSRFVCKAEIGGAVPLQQNKVPTVSVRDKCI